MNKGMMIAVAAVVILAAGGFFLFNQQSQTTEDAMMVKNEGDAMMEDDKMTADDSATEGEDKMMEGESMMKEGSRYVEYTSAALDRAASGRRVLYFYANWCPTCRPADADFQANADQIPEDVTVIRVNYNDDATDEEEKALANQYGVTYQHTFVQIDENGDEVTKWNGGSTSELLANIK